MELLNVKTYLYPPKTPNTLLLVGLCILCKFTVSTMYYTLLADKVMFTICVDLYVFHPYQTDKP